MEVMFCLRGVRGGSEGGTRSAGLGTLQVCPRRGCYSWSGSGDLKEFFILKPKLRDSELLINLVVLGTQASEMMFGWL